MPPCRTTSSRTPHFGHATVVDYCDRPFDDVEELTETFVERWTDAVSEDGTVPFPGDSTLSSDLATFLRWFDEFDAVVLLLPGDHDRVLPDGLADRHLVEDDRYPPVGVGQRSRRISRMVCAFLHGTPRPRGTGQHCRQNRH